MLTASELKAVLTAHQLRLTKRLGQHHLIDVRLVQTLMDRCGFTGKETAVEIGAGLGALTEELARRVHRVIAVEVDAAIAAILRERMAPLRNVTVQHADILEYRWTEPVTVVGAIPYHITSPIIVALSEARRMVSRAILVIQREVAQRLQAAPGTKAYGRLSVLGQYGWQIRTLLEVPRSVFFPQPDVDSRAIELRPRPRPAAAVDDEPLFFEVVKAAFAHRRKTLANCLKAEPINGRRVSDPEGALRAAGLPPGIRGEMLSLDQFAALTRALK